MIAPRGLSLVELDRRASEANQPYGIITVDCSNPCEIDDGIAVEPLPTAQETYRVSVFAADTSPLYMDGDITDRALRATEARYLQPETADQIYEPMLPYDVIRRLQFSAGDVRSALVISFLVGTSVPPSQPTLTYGQVEVRKNYRYDTFGHISSHCPSFQRFGQAAGLILAHANNTLGDEEQPYNPVVQVPRGTGFRRGSNINRAFMIGGNNMAATIMSTAELAIFRVYDPSDTTFADFINTNVARFSTRPGRHDRLGLYPYTRVTSPLRRLEDFIMHGLIRARHEGRAVNARDRRLVTATVQRLNQRIASKIFDSNSGIQTNEDQLSMYPRSA